MAETVSTNQFKNGMHIELEGGVWRIVDFQHVKPGKGGAFVRTKLKSLDSGSVVDKTFRAGEKVARIHTDARATARSARGRRSSSTPAAGATGTSPTTRAPSQPGPSATS